MEKNLQNIPVEALQRSVFTQSLERMCDMLEGISLYRAMAEERTPAPHHVLWRKGAARLLDYGGEGAPVLLIPSLINRPYVLDLTPQKSLVRFLMAQGRRPMLMDWGEPGSAEQAFDTAHYVMEYLIPALDVCRNATKQPPVLLGYCMGGLLAMALALHRQEKLAGLALLATPWDFHSPEFSRVALDAEHAAQLAALLDGMEFFPAQMVQAMFYAQDPWLFHRKYQRLKSLEPESAAAQDFVAIEQWVNDGVALATPVAKELLIDWVLENTPARGLWRVDGITVEPEAIALPCFVAMPERDRVVPPDSSAPLARRLSRAQSIHPTAGHVSMVVGAQAEEQLWTPLDAWMRTL